jgi:hypothetical protein
MTVASPLAYVYDGRECLGFILKRGKLGFEANHVTIGKDLRGEKSPKTDEKSPHAVMEAKH